MTWHQPLFHSCTDRQTGVPRSQFRRSNPLGQNERVLRDLGKADLVRGLKGGVSRILANCGGCKAHDRPHPSKELGAGEKVCLGRISMDLAGPFHPASLGEGVYNMVIVDEYSRKSWVEILRSKSDAVPRQQEWIAIWQRQSGKAVNNFRSDRGGEFFDGDFQLWLRSKGINHEPSPRFTPHANAITKRMNITLEDRARSMLLHMQIPPGLWAEAISHASYLRNRFKVTNLPKTSEEMWVASHLM